MSKVKPENSPQVDLSAEQAETLVKERADRVAPDDLQKVLKHESRVRSLLEKTRLGPLLDDAHETVDVIRDYAAGRYREIPWFSIAALVATLLYLLNPFDIVPDAIPFLGQVDDALVLAAALKLVRRDLKRYRKWKREQAPKELAQPDPEESDES